MEAIQQYRAYLPSIPESVQSIPQYLPTQYLPTIPYVPNFFNRNDLAELELRQINSPSALAAHTTEMRDHPPERKQHLRISLLQMLLDPEMLALCRDFGSRYVRDPADGTPRGLSSHERLDLTALNTAWRETWRDLPTHHIGKITFDINVADLRCAEERAAGELEYFLKDAEGVKVGVDGLAPVRLVLLLATETAMRKGNGEKVRFEFVCEGGYVRWDWRRRLREGLEMLGSE